MRIGFILYISFYLGDTEAGSEQLNYSITSGTVIRVSSNCYRCVFKRSLLSGNCVTSSCLKGVLAEALIGRFCL